MANRPTREELYEIAYAWTSFNPSEHVLPRTKMSMLRMKEIFNWIYDQIEKETGVKNED